MRTAVPSTTQGSMAPPCPRSPSCLPHTPMGCSLASPPCYGFCEARLSFPQLRRSRPSQSRSWSWGFSDHWCALIGVHTLLQSGEERLDTFCTLTAQEETQLASLCEEICPITPSPFPVLPLMSENLSWLSWRTPVPSYCESSPCTEL